MISLSNAVFVTLGGGIGPLTSLQTAVASSGLFIGGIINANIFGELSVILSCLDKYNKIFQSKMALTNTSMIDLKLSQHIKQEVRHTMYRNQPT